MKRSSIYNRVHNQARKSDCSFGASGGFSQDIRVGWGSSDSHSLARIVVDEVRIDSETRVFNLFVNGELIRQGTHKKGTLDVDWVL